MVEILKFDDLAQMQEQLKRNRDAANAGLAAAQKAVTYGSYWVRFHPVAVIFGYVDPIEQIMYDSMNMGAGEDEAHYEAEQIEAAHREGMMWGLAYSKIEPGGEYGYTHRANLWPIEERLFRAAKQVTWGRDGHLPIAMRLLLKEAHTAFSAHVEQAVRARH